MPIRTLHIDIEGGWGGSSVSLFELVRRVDRQRVSPIVVYRQLGPAAYRYREIDVPAYHVPDIASFVPRKNKVFRNLAASIPRLLCLGRAADEISKIALRHSIDLIHLNYEGLFLLGAKLRERLALPLICHSRTLLPETWAGRGLVRRLADVVDGMFFISPQEEARWHGLSGSSQIPAQVMWNVARAPLPRQPYGQPPEIVYLGNIDHTKGTDRLLDIAAELNRRNAPPLRFTIYGRARNNADYERKFLERIRNEKLESRIEFCGHVPDPSEVLARAFALIRPSRENDPWGRDVIEATAAGVPVLATGGYEGVIQSGVNGYLFEEFYASEFSDRLLYLQGDPAGWQRLSEAGKAIGREKFGGGRQAEQFAQMAEM